MSLQVCILSYLVSCSDLIWPILIHSRNEDLGYFGNNPYIKIDYNILKSLHFSVSIYVMNAQHMSCMCHACIFLYVQMWLHKAEGTHICGGDSNDLGKI